MVKRIEKRLSVEDRIKPITEMEQYLTMLCYGQAGRGKTVFACSFPKPLLLLDIREEGQDSVSDVEDVDLLAVEHWQDIEDAYWMLAAGKTKYKSVVIDQLTALQALAMSETRDRLGMKPTDPLSQRSWGNISGLMQTWVFNFRELKKQKLHVCFNAHERLRDAEETDDDRIAPSVGSNLTPSIASFVNGAVAVIGNAFIRELVDKKAKTRDVQFCMRIGPHAYYAAKVRRPVSAGPAPDVIVNPNFDKILAVTKGKKLVRKM